MAINIKEPSISIGDLNSELPWVKKLNNMLAKDSFKDIFLIMRVLPTNGIDIFMGKVQSLPNGKCVR